MGDKKYYLFVLFVAAVSWAAHLTDWNLTLAVLSPWAPWVTVIATALSPLIAVQVVRILDRGVEKRREQTLLFHVLMEYRSAEIQSPEFCRAMNLVDVVFSGVSKNERKIQDALNDYRREVNKNLRVPDSIWAVMSEEERGKQNEKLKEYSVIRSEALNRLLYAIAESLDLNINYQAMSAASGFWPAWVSQQFEFNRQAAQATIDMRDMMVNSRPRVKKINIALRLASGLCRRVRKLF